MSLVKVSVEDHGSRDAVLCEIDKSKTLQENIKSVCRLFSKPVETDVYALKLISTNNGKSIHTYISEDNIDEIKDGYSLKLAYSLNYYIKRIFDHIDDDYKQQSFNDLHLLSVDPEFIKELVKFEKHLVLIEIFTERDLINTEITPCLMTILHLFSKGCITDIAPEFLDKLLKIVKIDSPAEQVKYTLSILHRILCLRDSKFDSSKENIIQQLPLAKLMLFIPTEDLQFGTLLLINRIIRCCKGEKRLNIIRELNKTCNRMSIFKHIIKGNDNNVDKLTAHELYVVQTNLLSLNSEALKALMSIKDLKKDDLDIEAAELRRITTLMDFDEDLTKAKPKSVENLLDIDHDARFSLVSVTSSKCSEDDAFRNTFTSIHTIDGDNIKMSLLTSEAYDFYRDYHSKNFQQSQIEERVYEPGIFVTSEAVMKILASLLHIGREPDRNSTTYQPIVFSSSSQMPFLLELFCRAMWLLSRTRREMKASTLHDYGKVINVLEKQLRLVLEEKPIDIKSLGEKMVKFNYEYVTKRWQKEQEEEMEQTLNSHPSVQVLKEKYVELNKQIVYKQRLNFVQQGTTFPKITEKKITGGRFKAKVSSNCKDLILQDFNLPTDEPKSYPLENVTHIIEGKACPQVAITKEPLLAFSIIINNSDYLNFSAPNRQIACYWIDALNLLLDKEVRTEAYKKELEELVRMDLVLHLMEIQNVTLPKKPPPVPPTPFEVRPPIPPKPHF